MKPSQGLILVATFVIPVACTVPPSGQALDPSTPGYTGTTVVVGNNNTIAGDAEATYLQQKWGVGRQR